MTPPSEFVRALTAYDPALVLRWQVHREIWAIYERMPERHHRLLAARPNPWKGKRGLDLHQAWKEGLLHVLDVPPEKLHWNLIVPTLDWASVVAKRRIEDVNTMLDEIEAQEEAARERDGANRLQAATSEAFDRLQWLNGNRIGWHAPAETKITPLEAREGYYVTDRRAVTA